MDVYYATEQHRVCNGMPRFEEYEHVAIPPQRQPYKMQIPQSFLPWDRENGIIAFRRHNKQIAVCRCGVILVGIYFRLDVPTQVQIPIALKTLDRSQVTIQKDDMTNEIRIMSVCQRKGIDAPLHNPYMIRWEFQEDQCNYYLAMEYISNGSFKTYAHKKIQKLMLNNLRLFLDTYNRGPSPQECVSHVYRDTGHEWIQEAISIFTHIMRGLTYLHAQNVAHLDLDIFNIAIDRAFKPRIIDYGSSLLMDHRCRVGVGNIGIKCKPLFAAPEVRTHARLPTPRPGFDGMKADLWSAGVVLVQCIVWGFQSGSTYLKSNVNWRSEVFRHIDGQCQRSDATRESCYLCRNFITIPILIGKILKGLLHLDPRQRPSAYDVVIALQNNNTS